MKTNNELIREILKKVEIITWGETLSIEKLSEMLSEYNIEDILGMVSMLNREHFVIILDKPSYSDSDVFRENKIKGLTEKGYRVLDVVREDRIWNLIKEKLPNFNDYSFFMVASIAGKILYNEHNKLFNIDDNPSFDYSRW